MSKNRTVPVLRPETRHVSRARDLDGFTLPIGWNFKRMEKNRDCPWHCSFKRLNKFKEKLLAFEGKSFQNLEVDRGSNHGWADISCLNAKFIPYLKKLRIEEEALWQLEIGGKERLFGIREYNIFHVIWLDVCHTICQVKKKNT